MLLVFFIAEENCKTVVEYVKDVLVVLEPCSSLQLSFTTQKVNYVICTIWLL